MATDKNDLLDRMKQIGDLAEQVSDGIKVLTGEEDSKSKNQTSDSGILGKITGLFGSKSTSKSKKKIKQAGGDKASTGGLDDLLEKAESLGEAKEALEKIQDLIKTKK